MTHANRGLRAMRLARMAWATFLICAMPLLLPGCKMSITPPSIVHDPVAVELLDHGNHASLVLPHVDGSRMEYAFGHYGWFALNHDHWWDAIGVALLPGNGTLGRRGFAVDPPASGPFAEGHHNEQPSAVVNMEVDACGPGGFMTRFTVERALATKLSTELNAQFDRQKSDEIYNPKIGMWFVPDERRYGSRRNCNSVVAEWLEAIGCRVTGCRTVAEFVVTKPPSEPVP